MNDPEKSEAAGAPTPTTSGKSENPVDQNKDSDSAGNVADPSPEYKDGDATEPPVEGDDGEQGDVAVEQGSNPVPATGGELSAHSLGADSQPKSEKKRPGRPKGSRNGSAKKKPAAKKPVGEAPGQASVHTPPPAIGAQKPGTLKVVARTDIVLREPFSTLLPIRENTYESIKAEMLAKGFDASHPVHLWDRDGVFILGDGYTRIKAADEVGITHIPAFIHYFQDESEALGFAIRCQTDRRNITDGEMFKLVIVYDEKVKPGSTQQRQSGGTYAPKASIDAPGKTAKKTAKVLNTTTTNIERARYLHKNADAATKAAITNGKMTLSRACDVVRKHLAAAPKAAKKASESKDGTKEIESLPYELTPESDVAFAIWSPVVRSQADLLTDPGADQGAEHRISYVLAEQSLDLPANTKKLGALSSHRLLVSPGIDLFADDVPAKIVRKVLQTAAAAKQFQFLFTTNNPGRLDEFSWEPNTFAGVSIYEQRDVAAAEAALLAMDGLGKWLIVEQLTMELTFKHLDQIDWLVVRQGAGVPGAAPDSNALKSLLRQAWAANCPVLFERGINYRPTDAPKVATEVPNHD